MATDILGLISFGCPFSYIKEALMKLNVNLPHHPYDILIEKGSLSQADTMKHIIAVLIENEAGALSRVVGLLSAPG